MKVTIKFLLIFLGISNAAIAQKRPPAYKGFYLSVGKFYTPSLQNLNAILGSNELEPFKNSMFQIDYGYSKLTASGLYFAFGGGIQRSKESGRSNTQSLISSTLLFSSGYAFKNTEKWLHIPQLGLGLGGVVLTVSEKYPNSSNDFSRSLFLTKTEGSLTLTQLQLRLAYALSYKIPVGDKQEYIEGRKIVIKRKLPIGIELGYTLGKDLGKWAGVAEISNGPQVNLSGVYIMLKTGSMFKTKTFD